MEVKDRNGAVLQDGDSVPLIKDLVLNLFSEKGLRQAIP